MLEFPVLILVTFFPFYVLLSFFYSFFNITIYVYFSFSYYYYFIISVILLFHVFHLYFISALL